MSAQQVQIIEMDTERDRKTCIYLDQKVTGANRELAQWLKEHPRYTNCQVGEWLKCNESRIRRLRKWANGGFKGLPFDSNNHPDSRTPSHKSPVARPNQTLESLDNSELGPIEEECDDCNTNEERWQRSLANLAGDAISVREYWTRQFGDWENFETPSELVTLAKQAAEVWTKLARELAK